MAKRSKAKEIVPAEPAEYAGLVSGISKLLDMHAAVPAKRQQHSHANLLGDRPTDRRIRTTGRGTAPRMERNCLNGWRSI